jgi:hypothetical protein
MTDDEIQDELPDELDVTGYVGRYTFPDIRRRRAPGLIYLVVGAAAIALWATHPGSSHVLVNRGFLVAGLGLVAMGAYHLAAAWPLRAGETDALVAAVRKVGFPVGHASAQLGWTGFRSRPVWRILLYSAEEPPQRRGVVLVDGVDGTVLFDFVEANPEDWSRL